MSVGAGAGAGAGVGVGVSADTGVVVADPFDTTDNVRVAEFSAGDCRLGLDNEAEAITELGAPDCGTADLCTSLLATCDVEIGVLATSAAAGVRLDDGCDGHKTINIAAMTTNAPATIPTSCHVEKRGSGSGT